MTDTNVCKQLYDVIRLNNTELFEKLIEKWQSDPDILQKTDNLLSKVYEELKLKDVPLSNVMQFVVEDKLLQLRFFIEKNNQNIQDVKASFEDVKKRIQMVCNCISDLNQEYSVGKEVNKKFFFIATFIAQNIHILKRQLRSTYNKLPWEEIEFCTVNFISSQTNIKEFNVAYLLVLNKHKLLNHLVNFAKKLTIKETNVKIEGDDDAVEEVGANIEESDVNSEFPKFLTRNRAVQSVISMWNLPSGKSLFQELYDDYELLKNIYSLKRIESYIKLALSIDLNKKMEIGRLVIERALQVVGESLKNTLESPNISDDICRMLLYSASRYVTEIITSLRDSLSHVPTLTKKLELESNDSEFFFTVQDDLRKIDIEIGDILYTKKVIIIETFLKKIINSKDLADVKNFAYSLERSNLGEMELIDSNTRELDRAKALIDELRKKIIDQTEEEKQLFSGILEIFDSQEIRLIEGKKRYIYGLFTLNNIIGIIKNCSNLGKIKILSRLCFDQNYYQSKLLPPDKLRTIILLVKEIFYSVMMRTHTHVIDEIIHIINKIIFTIQFEAERIYAIDNFKATLNKKLNITEVKVQEKVENVLAEIKYKIEDEQDRIFFCKELNNKKHIHEIKLELGKLVIDLDTRLVTKDDPLLRQKWTGLVEKLEISEIKKSELNKAFKDAEWNKCKTIVDKSRNSYQTLLDSVKNAMGKEKYDMSNYFKDFVHSVFKSKNRVFWNDLDKAIEITFHVNKAQLQSNLGKRLVTLKRLFSSNCDTLMLKEYNKDKELQAAVEMLVLDSTEILRNAQLFGDNRLFFDRYSPILIGNSLRNYLAHGDPLIENFPFNPSIGIISTAFIFLKNENYFFTKENLLIGQQLSNNLADLSNRYNRSLDIINNQDEMFIAAKEGNLPKVKDCITKGADIKARGTNRWTGMDFAVAGDNVEVFKYFYHQNFSSDIINEYGYRALHIAATSGSINILNYLAENFKFNVSNTDSKKRTLLHLAAMAGKKEIAVALLQKGVNVDSRDMHHKTPLYLAAENGHKKVVKVLLKKKANVNTHDMANCTPLHLAAQNGHKAVVEALLRKGADVNALAEQNLTPLHSAVFAGHEEVVKTLLCKGANIDAQTKNNETPLYFAGLTGQKVLVEALLKKGANVHSATKDNVRTLHCAAHSGHKEVVETLLRKGAHINTPNKVNYTPLHFAAVRGHKKVVQALLANGAMVNAQNIKNVTPLHSAAQQGHSEVVKVLIEKGAKVDALDMDNVTPLHMASEGGHKEVVEALLQKDADVNIVINYCNITPLHLAAQNGHKNTTEILIDNGAKKNAPTKDNWTPLHMASSLGHKDIVEVLLKHGAKVNALGANNTTPLHNAAFSGHKEVIEALLNYGAKLDVLNNGYYSPLHMATFNDHKEVVKILSKKSATVIDSNKDNFTPLGFASQSKYKEVVEAEQRKGAMVDAPNKRALTPFYMASDG